MKKFITEQFATCYDYNAWFVAVRNAIDGLNVEQAAWKPADGVNCIWETLSHLTYYNNAYLQRFKGIDYEYDVSSNDETFSTGEYTEDDWQADATTDWSSALGALTCRANKLAVSARSAGSRTIA